MSNTSKAEAILNKMSREERKAAREIRNDAADAMGVSRLRFNRMIANDDQEAIDELAMSLAESEYAERWEFDPERFQRFLDMIINFIKALMSIFGGFGFARGSE